MATEPLAGHQRLCAEEEISQAEFSHR